MKRMKRKMNKLASFLLGIVLALSLSITALAAESSVTFKGAQEGFDFQPGSKYTQTDLFDNFKNVMPGDKLTENIQIKNEARDCDYIKLYMRAEVPGENTASMQEFLSQLTMRIYNGTKLIYTASPDEAGALADNVLLGTLRTGESLSLKVELDVPNELGNEYANRMGEVDWVFLAECIEFEKLTVHKIWDDKEDSGRPDSIAVHLLRDGKRYEKIELNQDNQWTYAWEDLDDRYQWSVEEEVPQNYRASYRSEDNRVFITNYKEGTSNPTPNPGSGLKNLTVKKVWSDENNKRGIRPASVTVTLYNGDQAVSKVTLGAWNNWSYTWENLDGTENWSVLETGIPKGYTPSYRTSGDVVTITNTATLIQTGQLNWPIPVLGSLGAFLIFFGIFCMRRKKKDENA